MAPERERFAPSELAIVLSHYDLGVIESAKEFPRGSRRSPKLLLRSEKGRFLLKRRASGRDDPQRVSFTHDLLLYLHRHGFPTPRLVATRDAHASMLQLEGRMYELFEFVDGEGYDGSLDATEHAGLMLAVFHQTLAGFESQWQPPENSFHDLSIVRTGLNAIPSNTASHDSVFGHEAELLALTQYLHEQYDEAALEVRALGFGDWPVGVIHGDWHPGNMLFRDGRVVTVLDFDSARRQPRVIDIANGMLQFSILRGGGDPANWPDYFDLTRMRRFLMGYLLREPVAMSQRRAVPLLMIESLIAESAVPIAATGSLGPMPGFGVLQMIRRKVRWLLENQERLRTWLLET